MEGTLHLPHQLWGAAWGLEGWGGPTPSFSLQLRESLPQQRGRRSLEARSGAGTWKAGTGGRGWRRRREHTYTAPGGTKSCSATPPCSLRAGGHPHPAPARPKEAGTSVGHSAGTPARPRPARPRVPSAVAARLPGVPFGAGGSTRAGPWRPEPRPLHGAAGPPAEDRAAPARFLPSSGSRAQAALIRVLKLNTRAARQPPSRRGEPRRRQGSAPASAGGRRRPLAPRGGGARAALPKPVLRGRVRGPPAPPCSGSVDAVLQLEVTTQQSHLP